jgi:hypothetical protein
MTAQAVGPRSQRSVGPTLWVGSGTDRLGPTENPHGNRTDQRGPTFGPITPGPTSGPTLLGPDDTGKTGRPGSPQPLPGPTATRFPRVRLAVRALVPAQSRHNTRESGDITPLLTRPAHIECGGYWLRKVCRC